MEFQCSTRMRLCYRTTACVGSSFHRIQHKRCVLISTIFHQNVMARKMRHRQDKRKRMWQQTWRIIVLPSHYSSRTARAPGWGGGGNKNVPITRQSQRPVSSSLLLPVQLVNKGRPAELISRPKWRTYFGSLGARNFTTLFLFSPVSNKRTWVETWWNFAPYKAAYKLAPATLLKFH